MKKYLSILILLLAGCVGSAGAFAEEASNTPLPEQHIVIDAVLTPTATPMPSPTPAPTPELTPTPLPPSLTFTASLDMPLPTMGTQIQRRQHFWIDGTVSSNEPLILVRAEVINGKGAVELKGEQRFSPEEGVKTCRLLDETFSRDIDCVSEQMGFQELSVGTYTLRILGQDAASDLTVLAETQFQVSDETWYQLLPNLMRLNYTTALEFFGSPERFMFRYRMQSGSYKITIDPDWVAQYVGTATCLNGKKWMCHVDAIPYFEQACRYLENTYIHVTGRNFDTGPMLLSELVVKMDGTMIRRLTNSGEFISHHSFGTAVDINSRLPSNKDNQTNRDKIFREVQQLTYNGIVTVKDKQCYDFTYAGTARGTSVRNVPEVLTNYFLYELAFYRAGFSWGAYYPHKSDAMHFTLTELSPALFTDGPYAMRKVFSYIEDMPAEGISDSAPN